MIALNHHRRASGRRVLDAADSIAPQNGDWLIIDANATLRGAAWNPDTNGAAYPRDNQGAFAYNGGPNDGTKIAFVQAASIQLDALTGFGTGGTLGYRIVRASDSAPVYSEDISQAGPDDGRGSNRSITLPYDNYYLYLERVSGTVAVDGFRIRNY